MDQELLNKQAFEQKLEIKTEDNLQINLQKQETLGNIQQDAQKSQTLQVSEQEKIESNINESFPVTKEKVDNPEGDAPDEPAVTQVEKKFESISGSTDKDYENVMETYEIYRQRYQGKNNVGAVKQLRNLEINASRYTRWKFRLFMSKKSVKYKRFMQMKQMEEFAIKTRKEVQKNIDANIHKNELTTSLDYTDNRGGELDFMYQKRSVPMKILTWITGTAQTVFQSLGRAIFAVQQNSNYEYTDVNTNYTNAELHAQFLTGLFKKKIKADKQAEMLRQEEETNNFIEEEEELPFFGTEKTEDQKKIAKAKKDFKSNTKAYKGLINMEKGYLNAMRKGRDPRLDPALMMLWSTILRRREKINKYNEGVADNMKLDVTEADSFVEQINKEFTNIINKK